MFHGKNHGQVQPSEIAPQIFLTKTIPVNLVRRILLVGTLIVVSAALVVGLFGLPQRIGRADIAVVFGTTVDPDGHPSKRLAARLDKAANFFRAGLCPYILVSGGLGKEGFSEGSVMKAYLIGQGVSGDHIFVDNAGSNTYNTAKNASILMQERKMASALLISQFFHLPRARLAFTRFGITQLYYGHPDYYELRDIYSLIREVFALCQYPMLSYPK